MSEQIRVLDKDTGHVRTVHAAEVAHGNYERLDDEAVDANTGVALPPVFNQSSPAELVEDPSGPVSYDDLTVPALKDAIEARNTGRDEEALIPGTGNKSDLVKALETDDALSLEAADTNPSGHRAENKENTNA